MRRAVVPAGRPRWSVPPLVVVFAAVVLGSAAALTLGASRPPANATSLPQVTIAEHAPGDYVVFQNRDARYYIGLRCGLRSQSIGSWKPLDMTVGPGYISRIVRLVGGTRTVAEPNNAAAGLSKVMDGNQVWVNALLQGVGVFGTHLAVKQGASETYGVANANYCWSDAQRPDNLPSLAGVKSSSVVAPPTVHGDVGSLSVDVVIGDDYANILKIRYDIRVHASVVYQWTTVTVLCGNGDCRRGHRYYVKEPKIVVSLNGAENDYKRVSCWDSSTSWSSSAMAYNRKDGTRQYAKWTGNRPWSGTMRCVAGSSSSSRGRALFDYGGEASPTTPSPRNCADPSTTSERTCFVVTGRGFTPPGGRGSSLSAWQGGGSPPYTGPAGSFDRWAVKSAGATRLSGGTCSSSTSGTPASNSNTYSGPDNRRWELYGWQPNELGRNERGVIFKAWEGGVGPANCRRLFARLGPVNDRWGAFNAYSFGTGWENLSKPG